MLEIPYDLMYTGNLKVEEFVTDKTLTLLQLLTELVQPSGINVSDIYIA